MANKFFNEQLHGKPPAGGGRSAEANGSGSSGFKVKQGYAPGLPGKSGPNRSNGVEKARVHPSSEGL